MPAPKDPEFRRRAVELARLREKPIAQIAKDLGIPESGLRRWMAQADVDEGKKEWIEAFYNPVRRHSGLDYRTPVEVERLHKTTNPAA
jgi:transposase-like protein